MLRGRILQINNSVMKNFSNAVPVFPILAILFGRIEYPAFLECSLLLFLHKTEEFVIMINNVMIK